MQTDISKAVNNKTCSQINGKLSMVASKSNKFIFPFQEKNKF